MNPKKQTNRRSWLIDRLLGCLIAVVVLGLAYLANVALVLSVLDRVGR
jgi:hypothetical protein